MRAILILIIFLLLVALAWAIHLPLASYWAIEQFSKPGADCQAVDQMLQRAGDAALPALRHALDTGSDLTRLRAARLLAMRGDRDGDRCLLELIRKHAAGPQNSLAALAESYLLGAWDERGGPEPEIRSKLKQRPDPVTLAEALEKHPGWSAGYVRKARVHQLSADGFGARRYALIALMIEPDNFEAMTVLAQAFLLLDFPEQAYICIQQAVRLNPRLKNSLREDIEEIFKSMEADRARRRREHRKEISVA